MKIGVCVKQVPDTETRIRINDTRDWISDEGVKFVVNPYDEYALEEALRAKEKFSGEVVTITVGPKRCTEAIRSALAMGADRAIHIVCDDYKLDALGVSKLLRAAIEKEGFDVIFMGKQAVDNDFMAIGPMLSQMLSWASGNVVIKLDFSSDGKTITVEREVDGGAKEVLDLSLPALITATKGLNTPRYPALKGIMQAKKKEIKEMTFSDLGLSDAELTPKIKLGNFRMPPERKAGKIIPGEPEEAAAKLVELLRSEAKII